MSSVLTGIARSTSGRLRRPERGEATSPTGTGSSKWKHSHADLLLCLIVIHYRSVVLQKRLAVIRSWTGRKNAKWKNAMQTMKCIQACMHSATKWILLKGGEISVSVDDVKSCASNQTGQYFCRSRQSYVTWNHGQTYLRKKYDPDYIRYRS